MLKNTNLKFQACFNILQSQKFFTTYKWGVMYIYDI
jgi:hypothetical protein